MISRRAQIHEDINFCLMMFLDVKPDRAQRKIGQVLGSRFAGMNYYFDSLAANGMIKIVIFSQN
jgi:hypothetical protein